MFGLSIAGSSPRVRGTGDLAGANREEYRFIPARAVMPKLRRILSFLQDMEREEELRTVPSWKAHQLVGDRKDVWSLSVTKNWRITFRIDQPTIEIVDLDYEDYH